MLDSFVIVSPENDFPIQNIPFGVFLKKQNINGECDSSRIGVAIGDFVLDLSVIDDAGLLTLDSVSRTKCFHKETLNTFMSLGLPVWREVRHAIQKLLSSEEPALRDNPALRAKALIPMSEVQMQLPAAVGDYTDFYASKDHASNCGKLFGRQDNPLLDNWKSLPVGYHGRSSSIVVSDTDVLRPKGQLRPTEAPPTMEPSRACDFELEMGFFVGVGNPLGHPIDINNARDHIFGMVLLNDWSARDIQKYEYIPLGPFGAKNFATSISPWVVTLDALAPFSVPATPQDLAPVLPYLTPLLPRTTFNVTLQVSVLPELSARPPSVVCTSNLQNLYWTCEQMLSHHTVTGCNMRPGDLFGSGTISGPEASSRGCMLEASWGGSMPVLLEHEGEHRVYLEDGDTVTLSGYAQADGYRVGFGDCRGKLLPSC